VYNVHNIKYLAERRLEWVHIGYTKNSDKPLNFIDKQ